MSSTGTVSSGEGGLAEIPIVFGGCVGALHLPASPSLGCVVVLCAPVGREARCAHRTLWCWARQLASLGFHVLRYDHRGEGDSLDLEADCDQWTLWVSGVAEAASFARSQTGAGRLVLAGLRVGATLAASAAAVVKPDALVLLSPFTTGEAWLREVRLAARVKGGSIAPDGALQVDGLHLMAATVRTADQVRLDRLAPAARAVLVAGPESLAQALGGLGSAVDHVPFPGLAAMFKDAHLNQPAWDTLGSASDWLVGQTPQEPAAGPALPITQASLSAAAWTERHVVFGPGLKGVLCLPRAPRGKQAVVFGNTGADPRYGIGSFAARASRALASDGVAALRMDFAGLGESASIQDWRSHVYEDRRDADLRAAAELLEREGYADITLAGVCTGGYHAVHAVLAGSGFRKAVAFNSWLVWRAGDSMESPAHKAAIRPSNLPIFNRVGTASAYRRFRRALEVLFDRLERLRSAVFPDSAARSVREAFAKASGDDVRIHLVFGVGDASMRGLDADFHLRGRWLARRRGVSVHVTPGLEHALFSRASQEIAIDHLRQFLGVAQDGAGAPRGRTEPSQQAITGFELRPEAPLSPA